MSQLLIQGLINQLDFTNRVPAMYVFVIWLCFVTQFSLKKNNQRSRIELYFQSGENSGLNINNKQDTKHELPT